MAEAVGNVAGNFDDKYATGNPISRFLVARFLREVMALAASARPSTVHEVGCGEGELAVRLAHHLGVPLRASDVSAPIVAEAQRRHAGAPVEFGVLDVEEADPERDGADLVVCCEVLEHVPDPEAALAAVARLASPHLLVSVPREPVWRLMNMARGKYLAQGGNTPGHINHWSKGAFLRLLSRHVEVLEVRAPLPWTMALCRSHGE